MKNIVKLTESDLVRIVQRVIQEGKTDKGVKEKDADVKIEKFQDTIKNFIKSQDCKVKQVGNDFEIHCDGKHVGQVMFRKDGITVKKQGSKFGKEFDFNELGKVKTEIKKLTESDLTNIVKRVIKENSVKDDLIQSIKDEGWDNTTELVGGDKNLAKLAFNNNPMDFLHMFDDLDVVESEENKWGNWMLYRYIPRRNIIAYDTKRKNICFNLAIWWALTNGFGIESYDEILSLVGEWSYEVYGLRDFNSVNFGLESAEEMV
jgi:hypothetical protein